MKFVTISDVHIKDPGDENENLFLRFLHSREVKECDVIFLLGDIFDLVVGGHKQYRKKFSKVFDMLISLASSGKKIYQFEGNHDFHFKPLIDYLNNTEIIEGSWEYYKAPLLQTVDNQKILFAHGDELERDNHSYQLYRWFIRSRLINNLANLYYRFEIVEGIGRYLSKKSRKRNIKNYGQSIDQENIKKRFRNHALWARDFYNCDTYICGHSHCMDEWSSGKFTYLNNGYFPKTKCFFSYDSGLIKKVDL